MLWSIDAGLATLFAGLQFYIHILFFRNVYLRT